MTKTIHQEVVFNASPGIIYEALTDSKQFSEMTGGAPTEISRGSWWYFFVFWRHDSWKKH